MWLLLFALGLLLLSIILWGISRWQRNRLLFPAGRVIHIDTERLRKPEGTLFSANYSLVGRPDYLVNQGGWIIPIEVKSSAAPVTPYPSHLYQLAAYGLLVKEHFGRMPPYGILKYRDRAVEIPFTESLLDEVTAVLDGNSGGCVRGRGRSFAQRSETLPRMRFSRPHAISAWRDCLWMHLL